jgi:hypothetical protein
MIFLKNTAFGQDKFKEDIWMFSLLNFNIDLNYSEDDGYNNGFSMSSLSFSFEKAKSGIGFEIIPLEFQYYQNEYIMSIFHLKTYWNILNLFGRGKGRNFINNSIFGPSISINYPYWILSEDFSFRNYLLNIGFRYTLRTAMEDPDSMIPLLSIEAGYRVFNGTNNYYINIGINLLSPILAIWAIDPNNPNK